MKILVALACLIAAANALPALLSTGTSSSSRSQDAAGNYAFAYNEQHATGGSSRSESGNGHTGVVGSYSLNVADGRQRLVQYVADGLGFRAAISTNEPGTAAQSPAATAIASPYLPPEAPLPLAHGPAVAVAAAAPAPVAVAAPVLAPAPAVLAAPHAYAFEQAPAYAAPAYAAPAYAAPVAVAHAPVAVAPAFNSYSSSINHAAPYAVKAAIAAPAVFAAPAHAAPVLAAAPAYAKAYY